MFLCFERTLVQLNSLQIWMAGVEDTSVTSGSTVLKPHSLFLPCPCLPLCLSLLSQCKQITLSNTQCLLPALKSPVFFMRNDRGLCNPLKRRPDFWDSLRGLLQNTQTVTTNTHLRRNISEAFVF